MMQPMQFAQLGKKKHIMRLEFGLIVEFINGFHPFAKLMLDDRVSPSAIHVMPLLASPIIVDTR